MTSRRQHVFRPFSLLYFLFLLFWLLVIVPFIGYFFRSLLVLGVGLPPEAFGAILFVSLMGSSINIPVTSIRSRAPIVTLEEVRFYRVTWRVPRVAMGVRETEVTVNVGGALVPLAISAYLLFWSIPMCSFNLTISYLKLLIVLVVVTLTVFRSARVVKGLGIATPAFVPPAITALTTYFVNLLLPASCPTQIAYIGGTLGTLIGADLLNLNKIADVGAPSVSIGGAGTFDGIYLTGLISVLLITLLI